MMNAIDLFAGAGGLSYGFLMNGNYRFIAAAEINENARKTYEKNIVGANKGFIFIENVVGYDFVALNESIEGNVDVVIGGPPCQGFSNANRQKNSLISLNNSLIKDYFRAIKQIRPKAFVLENVSMLRSDKHRFYESTRDYDEIQELINNGYSIPKREDRILLSQNAFDGVELTALSEMNFDDISINEELMHLLSVLGKNLHNDKRLPNYLKNKRTLIIEKITEYVESISEEGNNIQQLCSKNLMMIKDALRRGTPNDIDEELNFVVELQKLISFINEIRVNGLLGEYEVTENGGLAYKVNSYSVIDYVNAILGDAYIQKGDTLNAKWFGVPQDRKRYIVIGIRKDIYDNNGKEIVLPNEPERLKSNTVGDAINDLAIYKPGYSPDYEDIEYKEQNDLSSYAELMRSGSDSVKNHITTSTTDTALERFRKIKQGKNFHSLSKEDKATYSNPERTQNTIYLRLNPFEPSGTVVNVRKSMWIHPTLDRAITVREAARLQSFPDRFRFCGSKDSQYQQVGNAVPPLMAKAIADVISDLLE